jgi:elongation factor Tu
MESKNKDLLKGTNKDLLKGKDLSNVDNMVCIGTIGHVDHGKTSLTSAITKVLGSFMSYDSIDDGKEEKARGITIVAKHVLYKTKSRSYTHVDCPGHADYIKNMIVGSSQLDIAILVVSVTDGPMPQTREHLNLISSIGVPSVVVFFNKADLIEDKEYILMIIEETMELVEKYNYKNTPYVVGSAVIAKDDEEHLLNSEGQLVDSKNKLVDKDDKAQMGLPVVKELMDIVDSLGIRQRELDKPFLMQVEDVVSITGRGTVATGRVIRGILKVGQEIEIIGYIKNKIKTTVTSIEMFKKQYPSTQAGHDTGLLLRGLDRKHITRGCMLAQLGSIKSISIIQALIYVNSKEEQGRSRGFRTTYKPQFFFRSSDVTGKFISFENDLEIINPGEYAKVTIQLEREQAIEQEDKFIIRESGITVAVGTVTSIDVKK